MAHYYALVGNRVNEQKSVRGYRYSGLLASLSVEGGTTVRAFWGSYSGEDRCRIVWEDKVRNKVMEIIIDANGEIISSNLSGERT